jgi:23S rRNA (guanosine2251-2'-O)-methyltransferase
MKIVGRNPVYESLVARAKIKKLYINQEITIDEKVQSILDMAADQGVPVLYKTKRFLNNLTENAMHQGVVADKEEVTAPSLEMTLKGLEMDGIEPFILYIRDAYNEFNVGAIIRSAEAVGVNAVIIPPKMDITPNMVRSAMGATEHVPVIKESIFQAIKIVKPLGIKVVGIELTGEDYYYNSDLKGPIMLIIGGEDHSLSDELKEKADYFVKIPMKGKVNSLNMSVAASVVLFDKLRQESL